jgi:hypothetical protein
MNSLSGPQPLIKIEHFHQNSPGKTEEGSLQSNLEKSCLNSSQAMKSKQSACKGSKEEVKHYYFKY